MNSDDSNLDQPISRVRGLPKEASASIRVQVLPNSIKPQSRMKSSIHRFTFGCMALAVLGLGLGTNPALGAGTEPCKVLFRVGVTETNGTGTGTYAWLFSGCNQTCQAYTPSTGLSGCNSSFGTGSAVTWMLDGPSLGLKLRVDSSGQPCASDQFMRPV